MFTVRTFAVATGVSVAAGAAVLIWRRLRHQRRDGKNTATSASPSCGQPSNEATHSAAAWTDSTVEDYPQLLNGLSTDIAIDAQLCKELSPVTDVASRQQTVADRLEDERSQVTGNCTENFTITNAADSSVIHLDAVPTDRTAAYSVASVASNALCAGPADQAPESNVGANGITPSPGSPSATAAAIFDIFQNYVNNGKFVEEDLACTSAPHVDAVPADTTAASSMASVASNAMSAEPVDQTPEPNVGAAGVLPSPVSTNGTASPIFDIRRNDVNNVEVVEEELACISAPHVDAVPADTTAATSVASVASNAMSAEPDYQPPEPNVGAVGVLPSPVSTSGTASPFFDIRRNDANNVEVVEEELACISVPHVDAVPADTTASFSMVSVASNAMCAEPADQPPEPNVGMTAVALSPVSTSATTTAIFDIFRINLNSGEFVEEDLACISAPHVDAVPADTTAASSVASVASNSLCAEPADQPPEPNVGVAGVTPSPMSTSGTASTIFDIRRNDVNNGEFVEEDLASCISAPHVEAVPADTTASFSMISDASNTMFAEPANQAPEPNVGAAEVTPSPVSTSATAASSFMDNTFFSQELNTEMSAKQNGSEKMIRFYIPTSLCGLFIGKKGRNVNHLKAKTGAYIHVEASPTAKERHLCVVKGDDDAINRAVEAIIMRFPQLEPELRFQPLPDAVPSVYGEFSPVKLQLVPQSPVSVLLASIIESTRVSLQLPTHPTFPSLAQLTSSLVAVYSGAVAGELPPPLDEPVMSGMLCAVESNGVWYRGQIVEPHVHCGDGEGANSSSVKLCYVDYGSYEEVPSSRVRKLRMDFLSLPFQAVECVIAHVDPPHDSLGESIAITTLLSFSNRNLECVCVGEDDVTGLPLIELYAINNGEVVHLNKLLSDSRGMEWLTDGTE